MAYQNDRVALSVRRSRARAIALAAAGEDREQMLRRLAQAAGLGALVAIGAALLAPAPASALTMQECSAKYKAAQAAGTLGNVRWNDFRKAQCGDGASAAPAPAASGATAPAARSRAAPATQAPAAVGAAVFPRALSQKYSNEKPAKQRLHTCLDQYNANKATNGNGGLKWIQKGGGYYSECNKRLKS